MANAQPGGDVSQRGPSEYLDPLAPLSSQFQQLKSMMELVFDDYEEFLHDLNRDVLALPREERFTRSHEVLREHVEDQFGSADAFAAVFPQSDPDNLPAFLEQVFDKLLTDVLEGVFFQRNPEDHLILAALFQTLNYSIQQLTEADKQEVKNRIASTMLALVSRLQSVLSDSPETLPEEAVWDTAYGLHYVTAENDRASFPNPAEMSFAEAKQEVIEFGAMIAYARLDISLSRGAELADVTPDEFRDKLDRFDVQPRFGPNSVEELYEDGIDE
ncbi:MAG: hypothetical protein V5A39_10330 [Haloarculaceae archaeon]